jgi:hypothetical protein
MLITAGLAGVLQAYKAHVEDVACNPANALVHDLHIACHFFIVDIDQRPLGYAAL